MRLVIREPVFDGGGFNQRSDRGIGAAFGQRDVGSECVSRDLYQRGSRVDVLDPRLCKPRVRDHAFDKRQFASRLGDTHCLANAVPRA